MVHSRFDCTPFGATHSIELAIRQKSSADTAESSTDTAKKFNRYGKKVQPIRQKSSTDTAKKFNRYGKKAQPIRQKSSTDTAKKLNRYGKKVQPIRQKSSTDTYGECTESLWAGPLGLTVKELLDLQIPPPGEKPYESA